MSHARDIPVLHVEGKDDLYTIAALLERHGVDMSEEKRPLNIRPARDRETKAEGVEQFLAIMADAIRAATNHPVGFVLDVDVKVVNRWKAVSARLVEADLAPPPKCPSDGYLGKLPDYPHSVGVWMMPDCIKDHGKLEHLLKTLVPSTDRIWPHAVKSTDEAKESFAATFSAGDRLKAVTHCWLAWQKDPGVPFGTAISAEFFGHDSQEALAFVKWLKRLYGLTELSC